MLTQYRKKEKEKQKESDLEIEAYYNKEVEYYSNLVNNWILIRIEQDKLLLGLSTGAIGLLITYFQDKILFNSISFYIFILANILFISSIIIGILIFRFNAFYIKDLIQEKPTKHKKLLKNLDFYLIICFGFGVFFTILLSVLINKNKLISKEIEPITQIEKNIKELKTNYEKNLLELNNQLKELSNIETIITKNKVLKEEISEKLEKYKSELSDINNQTTVLKNDIIEIKKKDIKIENDK